MPRSCHRAKREVAAAVLSCELQLCFVVRMSIFFRNITLESLFALEISDMQPDLTEAGSEDPNRVSPRLSLGDSTLY